MADVTGAIRNGIVRLITLCGNHWKSRRCELGNELISKIIEKSWNDQSFKQELLENPLEAIESVYGKKINLPEDKKLIIRDQSAKNVIYVNIPQNTDDVELREEQLEMVSGGLIYPHPGIKWISKIIKNFS